MCVCVCVGGGAPVCVCVGGGVERCLWHIPEIFSLIVRFYLNTIHRYAVYRLFWLLLSNRFVFILF